MVFIMVLVHYYSGHLLCAQLSLSKTKMVATIETFRNSISSIIPVTANIIIIIFR